ncbi:tRNA (adenosine(37)-N6)-threonylcarbamoyltransferase complex ATPase subunit type 1 TsaE [Chryseobacterium sp. A301]
MQFELTSLEQWPEVVKELLPQIEKQPVLLLKGNLGAGKTTFTKELVRQLGSPDSVSSPTYALVNTYQGSKLKIYHFDLYRLQSKEEVYDIGIEDYLEQPNTLCIVEWPEVFEEELKSEGYHELRIENSLEKRKVYFQ